MEKKHILFVLIIIALVAYPLLFESKAISGLGSDDAGPAWITSTGYIPWVHPLWTPPSDIESWLFAMQACIGGVIMGYFFGVFHVQAKMRKQEKQNK